ncbi:uncharacterized protein LOC123989223 [Osmia bicornis bicornis]|uniref:uncharacterized protein LOC123989223 n=1 Tax=Osmia bicornis bicornis TaxID=1437191 RepID=UPI001EAED1A7|nr:uncharacterized protein LOC123989223 [Osmia bicornis bicornis]
MAFKHGVRVIDEKIEKQIRPIYEDLSNDELLERCLGGHTQNPNESFNATVWRMTPKHLNSGHQIIEIAAYMAAGMFSEGYATILITMQLLHLNIGQQCKIFADTADAQRLARQAMRQTHSSKEARIARRIQQMQQNQFFEQAEGLLYGTGIAD